MLRVVVMCIQGVGRRSSRSQTSLQTGQSPSSLCCQTLLVSISPPTIEAIGLTKHYGDVHALAGLDLTAPAGKVTAVLGPNGAGKTTFVKAVATLLRPDSGSLSILDEPREPGHFLNGGDEPCRQERSRIHDPRIARSVAGAKSKWGSSESGG